MFFLIFLLNFGIQTLSIEDSKFFVFHHKNDFIILKGDSIYRSIDGLKWDSYKVKNTPIGFDYSYIKNNETTYIIKSGLGIVYKFNSLKNDFERLDNSFDWRSNYESYIFNYEGQINSWGGYGLFQYKNNLITFNMNSGEWYEKNNYQNQEDVTNSFPFLSILYPIKRKLINGQIDHDNLYIGSGLFKDKDLNRIWKYDLKQNKWSFLGVKKDQEFKYVSSKINPNLTREFKYSLNINDSYISGYDIKNNKVYLYKEADISLINDVTTLIYNSNNKKFLLITDIGFDFKKIIIIDEEKLMGSDTIETKFYSPVKYLYMSIFIIVFCLLMFFSIYILKKNKKPLIKKIISNKNILRSEMSTNEILIFNCLLDSYPSQITFPEILFFYEQNLSYESRIKKLRISISNIDSIIIRKLVLDKSSLNYSNNKDDKRIKQVSFK